MYPLRLFLLGLPKLASAQDINDEAQNNKAVTISVIGGAQIYSQDEALNQQIVQKRVNIIGFIATYYSDDLTEKLVIPIRD